MDIEIAPESAAWTETLPEERRRAIRELHALRPAWNLVAVVFLGLWAAAAWAMTRWPAWPVQAAGTILIGAVVHAMVILMHEGVHGNLFRREPLDRWVGFLLGAPGLFSCAAYRTAHLIHHRYNRTPHDPDEFTNLSASRRALSLAFYAWLVAGMLLYLVHVPLTAFRRGTPRQRRAVILEYALMALIYAGVLLAAWRFGFLEAVLRCWVAPLGVAALLGGVRGWAEHMLTRPGHPLTQSRTVTSNRIVSFFMCNLNYHLEHHLFPALPWYRLPRAHALLAEDYRAAGSPIYRSYLRFVWDALRAGVHGLAPRSCGNGLVQTAQGGVRTGMRGDARGEAGVTPQDRILWLALAFALAAAGLGCGGDESDGPAPAPALAAPADLRQCEEDGVTEIPAGGATASRRIVLKAVPPRNDGRPVALEAEVRPYDQPFTGTPNAVGAYVPDGVSATAAFTPSGATSAYRWRARTADGSGRFSPWVEYAPVFLYGCFFAFAHSLEDPAVLQEACAAGSSVAPADAPMWTGPGGVAALLALAGIRRFRRRP